MRSLHRYARRTAPQTGDQRIPPPGITRAKDSRYRGHHAQVLVSLSGRCRGHCAGAAAIGVRLDCTPCHRAPSFFSKFARRRHRRFGGFRGRARAWVRHTDRCIRARGRGHRHRVHDRQRPRAHDGCTCMRLRGARPARSRCVLHRRHALWPPGHPPGTPWPRSRVRRLAVSTGGSRTCGSSHTPETGV